ncbi:hypothetical protein DV702_00660 [Sporosarcina sp. PTS2304]|uniref:hypothetical protein n=1 Tax=Sporosarcina sp. PTS2304 TaxID=2283194 RepID=UPI000E0D7B98|nr:hypothetical protein [Sporosarcina sp. PTS2304]AXH98344.1 hypothetical protein DV702_00660 [Sporosarcina sp. PTS2304]
MKKRHMLAPLSLSLLLLGACNADSKEEKVDKEQTEPAEDQAPVVVDKSDTTTSNDELKDEFSKEEGVSDVSLIVTEDAGGFVLLDFEVTEDMKKEEAEKTVARFKERLEKEYPKQSIDIQARKSGETFVQETKEVK